MAEKRHMRAQQRFACPLVLLGVLLSSVVAAQDTSTPKAPPAPVRPMPPEATIALLGQPVVGPLGQQVGRVVDVLVDGKGEPKAAVIDFGGFFGMGSRKIAVQWDTLHFNPGDKKYPVVLDLLPEQLKAAPAYKGQTKPAPVVAPPWEAPPNKSRATAAETAAKAVPKTESAKARTGQ
jgi:PRC-barrel domain